MSFDLRERLEARRPEIEETILARVRSLEDPKAVEDPEYAPGLKGAVRTALGYAIGILEGGTRASEPLPAELAAQAGRAARNSVGLDTVLRRYVAGHTVLCDYLLTTTGSGVALPTAELRRALRAEASLLDRIVADVTRVYRQELEQRHRTAEQRRAERIKRLLGGEPQDPSGLGYDLGLWHLGVLATGPGAPQVLRRLAAAVDRRLLVVRPGGREAWAWLGGHRTLAAEDLAERARAELHSELTLAIGEPARGVSGWRLTHRQARAALSVALRDKGLVVKYSDVAILASVLGDELLTKSLSELYLTPLAEERDGGAALKNTLRAYFAAGHNTASTAAGLGVSRQTVIRRLHAVEQRIGRPLQTCATEMETALRLHDLTYV